MRDRAQGAFDLDEVYALRFQEIADWSVDNSFVVQAEKII
jgi:hypothetical protein